MTSETAQEVVPPRIAELLEERSTLLEWLERLEERREGVRPEVYERVRSDYGERLEGVETSLAGHRSDLEGSLARHSSTVSELEEEREDRAARLEEAELRHAVGELDEEEFEGRAVDLRAELEELVGRLEEERDAVGQLEEVLGELQGMEALPESPRPDAEPASEAAGAGAAGAGSTAEETAEESAPEVEATSGEPEPEPEAPSTPAAGPETSHAEEDDELDFLESLAWEDDELDTLSLVLDDDDEEGEGEAPEGGGS